MPLSSPLGLAVHFLGQLGARPLRALPQMAGQIFMSWVSSFRIPPPANKTILVRFGASILFAGYSRLTNQWFMLANGSQELISAPSLWWCEDREINKNEPEYSQNIPRERVSLRRSKLPQQLFLEM
jgi:hypothetical protein